MKNKAFWKFILDQLTVGKQMLLLTVVDHVKGSPGKSGFKLAFTSDKQTNGTIGGGIMEYGMIEQYSERLKTKENICELRYLVHAPNATHGEPSGLSCAGSQTNCALSLNSKDLPIITAIYNAVVNNTTSKLVITEKGIAYSEGKNSQQKKFQSSSAAEWVYEENIGPEFTLFIIGGGHVGNALSRIMATLDFYVIIYDERNDLPMLQENSFANKKIIAPYSELGSYIISPEKTFASIVTSNFVSDSIALQQLLPLHLFYVGIMGVEAKIARIKNSLNDFERELLNGQKIFAPIGMEIGSATAEEIAVSIAAELIKVKNEKNRV
ncbi:MAG: XdhC family protein [Bacteroidota bacterium]|nr:XdhC family protein [Bacteroidota bacterium]